MMEREMQMKSVKKFRAFLGGFILFLALMFTVGSVDVKAAAPKLNKKEDYHLCRAHRKAESKQCQEESEMDFFEKADRSCFF